MNAPTELFNQHLIDPEICIRCNTCEATCPVGAITHDSRNYVVIADKCNSCMACVPPCPTGSIDNWRMRPKAAAYTVEEQLLWDELPDAMSDSDLAALGAAEGAVGVVSTEASSASVIGSGVQSDVFKSAAYGATVPPWSAAHPYTNLYGPKSSTMWSSLPVYKVMRSCAPASTRPRTTSSVLYRLNGAILMATTLSMLANRCQNEADNKGPPTAGCR